ncbi:uncharacterized protein E0L32_009612 [Thyridium curvatum]|uniref:Uncharacterized protein n=1 Tax=Thyridium curvatum TaxID=1093900 RepID=A0A507AVN7_9PEZI|nr:uncharacterized protein E0L32_009612 [Thyridium curvatum]TPX08908.1 hypothetical protein E0L32_009612 [Thyridium curvatum]
MTTPEVSHGRGGAGNINKDDTKYVDGEVVRSGVEGSHHDGAYSTGRGGEFAIPFSMKRKSHIMVPLAISHAPFIIITTSARQRGKRSFSYESATNCSVDGPREGIFSEHPLSNQTDACRFEREREGSQKKKKKKLELTRWEITGAANIGDVGTRSATRLDKDVVPEAAIRPSTDNSDYHVGRGGAGNEHLSKTAEVKKANGEHAIVDAPMSLADKLKRKIFGGFGKK